MNLRSKVDRKICDRVMAIVRLRPGINSQNLAVAAGLPPKCRRGRSGSQALSYSAINRILKILEENGEIRTECIFDMQGKPSRVYPADFQQPEKNLFKPADHRRECKSYIDPAIAGTWRPEDAARVSALKVQPICKKEPPVNSKKQQILAELDRIEKRGVGPMPTKSALCRQFDVSGAYISVNPQLKARYYAVLANLVNELPEEPDRPTPEQAVQAIAELEERESSVVQELAAEVERLRRLLEQEQARAKQVEQRLSEFEQHPAEQPSIEAAIASDIESLKQSLSRVRDEKRQIEADERTIVQRLQSVLAYFELKTGDRYPMELEMVTHAGSNGKHLEVA